ncbi:hypothetical protein MKW94_000049, partial [Papaver nudicaule]|nr:hypothetical protein [Papaver nudicaule]MCL7052029.1 hypothetical protein [Papaver nudicaule]
MALRILFGWMLLLLLVLFSQIVLGYELREAGASHNCLPDAQAAMKLVIAKLERKFVGVIPLKRKEVSTFIPIGFGCVDSFEMACCSLNLI